MKIAICRYVSILVVVLSSPFALAGQHVNKCQSDGDSAKSKCEQAINAAKMADNAQSAGNIAGVGSSANIAPGGAALQGQIGDQTARLQQARATCEAEKQKCKSQCDSSAKTAMADDNLPPPNRNRDGDLKSDVDNREKKACTGAILPLIASLDQALGNLASDAGDTGKTQGQSGSGIMPLPLPMPSGGDDAKPKEEEKKREGIKCEQVADSYRYSDCNQTYISKCGADVAAAGCAEFLQRYCNINAANNGSADRPIQSGGTDGVIATFSTGAEALVTDKKGEGMTSDFCNQANAAKYCQNSAKSACLSCKKSSTGGGSAGFSDTELSEGKKTCPDDPLFLDPKVQAQMNSTPSTSLAESGSSTSTPTNSTGAAGSMGAGGGGGGSMGNTTGAELAADGGAVSEGIGSNVGGSLGADGGGGGGYSGGENSAGETYDARDPAGLMPKANGAKIASAVTTTAKDVAQQYGPSVFSIQSGTYQALCEKGKLLHCAK